MLFCCYSSLAFLTINPEAWRKLREDKHIEVMASSLDELPNVPEKPYAGNASRLLLLHIATDVAIATAPAVATASAFAFAIATATTPATSS